MSPASCSETGKLGIILIVGKLVGREMPVDQPFYLTAPQPTIPIPQMRKAG
jgi:hypothetical protein